MDAFYWIVILIVALLIALAVVPGSREDDYMRRG